MKKQKPRKGQTGYVAEQSRRGQIIEKGDNCWLVRWYVGRVEGKRVYQSETVHGTRRQADVILTSHLSNIGTSNAVIPSRKTLGQLINDYLTDVAPGNIAESTLLNWRMTERLYITDVLKAWPAKKLTFEPIQRMFNQMCADGYSAGTISGVRGLISVVCTRAVMTRVMTDNPCRYVTIPKTPKREASILEAGQVTALLDASQQGSTLYYAMWCIALLGGLRPSETLALKWGDLKDDVLTVQRALSKVAGGRAERGTKNDKVRSVVLEPRVIEALKLHRASQVRDMLSAGEGFVRNDYIFARQDGTAVELYTMRNNWQSILSPWASRSRFACTTPATPAFPCCSTQERRQKRSQTGTDMTLPP